jgi:hypothetical protein
MFLELFRPLFLQIVLSTYNLKQNFHQTNRQNPLEILLVIQRSIAQIIRCFPRFIKKLQN